MRVCECVCVCLRSHQSSVYFVHSICQSVRVRARACVAARTLRRSRRSKHVRAKFRQNNLRSPSPSLFVVFDDRLSASQPASERARRGGQRVSIIIDFMCMHAPRALLRDKARERKPDVCIGMRSNACVRACMCWCLGEYMYFSGFVLQ